MSDNTDFLRNTAATLVTAAGITQIALLWFAPLTSDQVAIAGWGAVYLFVGLGLFGISRTALVLGVILPSLRAGSTLLSLTLPEISQLDFLLLAGDFLVALMCAVVFLRLRHLPSF